MPEGVEIELSHDVCCNSTGFGGCRVHMKKGSDWTCKICTNRSLGLPLRWFIILGLAFWGVWFLMTFRLAKGRQRMCGNQVVAIQRRNKSLERRWAGRGEGWGLESCVGGTGIWHASGRLLKTGDGGFKGFRFPPPSRRPETMENANNTKTIHLLIKSHEQQWPPGLMAPGPYGPRALRPPWPYGPWALRPPGPTAPGPYSPRALWPPAHMFIFLYIYVYNLYIDIYIFINIFYIYIYIYRYLYIFCKNSKKMKNSELYFVFGISYLIHIFVIFGFL